MEGKDEEEFNSTNVSEESLHNYGIGRDNRYILNYDQMNVRNLKIDEILNRMTALRQQSQSLETVADPTGPSTSSQQWSSLSAPSTRRRSYSPPPGRKFSIFPEFPRQNKSAMSVNQLPAGCVRTAPSSPKRADGTYLHSLRAEFYGWPGEEIAASRYDSQPLPYPMFPNSPRVMSPRKTPPGHPFGLGSEKFCRPFSARDSVPIEFFMSNFKDESAVVEKKEKPNQFAKNDGHGDCTVEHAKSDNEEWRGMPDKEGDYGETDTK